MFASLKNKIREETGSDLSKLTSKITSTTAQRIESLRGLSQHGSSSSINSIVSSEGNKDEDDKKRSETDTNKRLDDKERDWKEAFREKDRRIKNLEKEKDEAHKLINILKQSLKNAEDSKQKLVEHQEDKEQIESYQMQELSKVKQLVLLRDQELAEKTQALKEANQQIQKHRAELMRLRKQEEQLSDVQDDLDSLRHSSARDLAILAADLAKCEEERRHLADLVAVFRQREEPDEPPGEEVHSESGAAVVTARGCGEKERRLLEQRLEEASLQLVQIKVTWSEKITALETQVGRLSRQVAAESAERRTAVAEKQTLQEQQRQLEAELECNKLEINNKDAKMRRLICEIEEMSHELKTLRAESEEQVTFLRNQIHNSSTEIKAIRKNLENTESELEKNEDECGKLKISVDSEHQTNNSLRAIIARLEKELSDERTNSLNVQRTLSRVTTEKNTALLRNAEISQQMEIVKQDTRRQENEMNDLLNKITQLEDENLVYKEKEKKSIETELRNTITVLEEQLSDKNKTIKNLQLRLADMKKTLQHELRTVGTSNFYSDITSPNATSTSSSSAAILTPSQYTVRPPFGGNNRRHDIGENSTGDVNFTYLKHVIIKFLTSREYEAQHLIRAVSTLLQFTAEEEKLIYDTLEWKMSWFGARPKLTGGKSSSKSGGKNPRS